MGLGTGRLESVYSYTYNLVECMCGDFLRCRHGSVYRKVGLITDGLPQLALLSPVPYLDRPLLLSLLVSLHGRRNMMVTIKSHSESNVKNFS